MALYGRTGALEHQNSPYRSVGEWSDVPALVGSYDLNAESAVGEIKNAFYVLGQRQSSPLAGSQQARETVWKQFKDDGSNVWTPGAADEWMAFVGRLLFSFYDIFHFWEIPVIASHQAASWRWLDHGNFPGDKWASGPQPTMWGLELFYRVLKRTLGDALALAYMPRYSGWRASMGNADSWTVSSIGAFTLIPADGSLAGICPMPGPGYQQRLYYDLYRCWSGLAGAGSESDISAWMPATQVVRSVLIPAVSANSCTPDPSQDNCAIRPGFSWENGACVSTAEQQCRASGKLWNPATNVCNDVALPSATGGSPSVPGVPASTSGASVLMWALGISAAALLVWKFK